MQVKKESIINLVQEARRLHREIYILNDDEKVKEKLLVLSDNLTTILYFLELSVANSSDTNKGNNASNTK